MPKFKDIKKMIGMVSKYQICVPIRHIKSTLKDYIQDYKLDLNPDFQRGYVWTEAQKIAYLEYILRGGTARKEIIFNCPSFHSMKDEGSMVIVDGKQRLSAVLEFLDDKIKVFGHYYSEYEDKTDAYLEFMINSLTRKEDVYQWYIELNSGGTIHSQEELDKVHDLIKTLKK